MTLTPGVTTNKAHPGTWTIHLSESSEASASELMDGVSQRLYGPGRGELHQPLQFETDFPDECIFALRIDAVSRNGGTLKITVDDESSVEQEWPVATNTHEVNRTYYLPLDAGTHQIMLEVVKGDVVRIDRYFLVGSSEELPEPAEALTLTAREIVIHNEKADGYRGIWFSLGQKSKYGDKYSGGLGTYTANHNPMAVYASDVQKTFFVYGGAPDASQRYLLCMVGCYDHKTGQVQRPTIVYDKGRDGIGDPHDDPAISIDAAGYIWVFVAGRNTVRDGVILRSQEPYSINSFEEIRPYAGMTYPQPWLTDDGFDLLFTKYTAGRELYFSKSRNGKSWARDKKLVGFGGHYQVSSYHRALNKLGTFFNYHPDGNVDRRTNLYYMQSTDDGDTWTTIDGTVLKLPLNTVVNPALVLDFEAQGILQYPCDINWDADGNPLLLYVTARNYRPGPQSEPREVRLTRWTGEAWVTSIVTHCTHNYDMGSLYVDGSRWTGEAWVTSIVTHCTHNYDMGSLYVDGSRWTILFPSAEGPQRWGTGGEIEAWTSDDAGVTWVRERSVTQNSERNHSYVRRPYHAAEPFMGYWADGDADALSISNLYFTNGDGTQVWQLPYTMEAEWETPLEVEPSDVAMLHQ